MATPSLRLETNVPGDFYVDASCIDCDACRLFAPEVFHDAGGQSAVRQQPRDDDELLAAQKALLACPTSSIGSLEKHDMTAALAAFPERIAGDVHNCGFTSESSFGAISYYLAERNILIDSPRFTGPLVKNLAAMGGVRRLLLTHQDDVADHAKFRERFGCERVLHRDDVRGHTAMVELQPGDDVELEPDLRMIATPGHTKGHAVFLYKTFLFTGDHLAWSESRGHLYAFRSACWYSWTEQIRSMEKLLAYDFEWVLPGHGHPIHLPAGEMRESLRRCIEWMRKR
jgi:glyoxylase-like metal-dependent hydrolase (beta-lactamase superfamily II)/ferredoxin